jgi:hypothetical protein
MKTQLQDYIKVYSDFIPKELCIKTIQELDQANFKLHTYYSAENKSFNSYEQDLSISYEKVFSYNELMKISFNGIYKYIAELKFPWFNSWNEYSLIRFNKYDVNTQMQLHCDHIHSLFEGKNKGIPFLSCVGALNDDYEGGEFIMFENTKIDLKQGDFLIFPSCFLYPHRVNKITKGVRHTFVTWAY